MNYHVWLKLLKTHHPSEPEERSFCQSKWLHRLKNGAYSVDQNWNPPGKNKGKIKTEIILGRQ